MDKTQLWSYPLQNKAQIRERLNEKRLAVGDVPRNMAAQQAMQLLIHSPLFLQANHIACYLARTEEFDCTPIIQAIWQANKKCYLPVLSPDIEGYLEFGLYEPEDTLRLNRFRILEPEHKDRLSADRLDLVLLPLVGFDLQGNRLGVGGGYYDRTFAFLRDKTAKKPQLFGLAYACQQVNQLPFDEWDVPLDGVLTENKLTVFSSLLL